MTTKEFDKKDLPKYGAPIKVGSEVMITDGSYTLTIEESSYSMVHKYEGLSKDVFTVVAVNVPVPMKESSAKPYLMMQNNCIIKSNQDGRIVFCSEGNITNIKPLIE